MQPHAKVTTDDDGTIHAISDIHSLTILPDGQSKAFNRNFLTKKVGGGKLHARLNNLAARIQQDKITLPEAWAEIEGWVEELNEPRHKRWLVGELDGVRCYINGNNIIMTKQDLYQ
jgi:hypothetical protein